MMPAPSLRLLPAIGLSLAMLACAGAATAQMPVVGGAEESQTVVNARQSLDQFFANPGESLPATMLQRAEGVAIFPNMIKGGFILGVNYGRGVLHVRNPDRTWSAPVMVTMGGGSVGFQVGVQSADILLVFATPRSLNGVLQGQKVTLGADASVAAGPVGVQANAGTDARLGAEIYSYARSRGLFMGVSLGGADLSVDNNANAVLYGRFGITPADVFQNRGLGIRPEVQQLIDDLNFRSGSAAHVAPAAVAAPATPVAFPPIPSAPAPVPASVPAPVPSPFPGTVPVVGPGAVPPPLPAAPAPTSPTNPPLVPIQR
jgi:lipid-binding SYLF domain-containing protein